MNGKTLRISLLFASGIIVSAFAVCAQQTSRQDESLIQAITGTNAQGSSVLIDPERNAIQVWKGEDTADQTSYENEPCDHTRNQVRADEKPSYTFWCAESAQSSLRGTKYVSRFVKGDCIKGMTAHQRYVCTAGCGKNSFAPRVLRQEYSSCAESFSASTQEKQRLLKSATTKPIDQKMVHELERELAGSCVGSENPSDLTATDLKYGRKATLALLSPASHLATMLRTRYGVVATGATTAIITMPPKHGRIRKIGITPPDPAKTALYITYENFEYTPRAGFHGKDRVSFEVDVRGTKFHASYLIQVADILDYACEN